MSYDKKVFQQDAKSIVDCAFDKKLFHDDVTRDHMNKFEDLIAYLLQSKYDGYVRCNELIESLKGIKTNQ